jgi:hypothetical protein
MFDYPTPGENSFINYQEFLSSGTWYRPKGQKYTKAWIMIVGGGGGANSAYSTSGGSGAVIMRQTFLSADSYTVTIGAGGAIGGAGGATSFGSLTANGGTAGGTSSNGYVGEGHNFRGNDYSTDFLITEYCRKKGLTTVYQNCWNYQRMINSTTTDWHGKPGGGNNSGLAGLTKQPGHSGYCVIFWEEAISKIKSSGFNHLKIQEFSASGTWYRPTRFPATLASIYFKHPSNNIYNFATKHFLTEDYYSIVIGSSSFSFGNICSSSAFGVTGNFNTVYTNANIGGCPGSASYDCFLVSKFEGLINNSATNSFIMYYE